MPKIIPMPDQAEKVVAERAEPRTADPCGFRVPRGRCLFAGGQTENAY